jgi:hypothetical protein
VLAAAASALALAAASPTQAGALWPTMRHDTRNTGAARSARAGTATGRGRSPRPWDLLDTVTGADGTVYVGSAERSFYALDAGGRERSRCARAGSSTPRRRSGASTAGWAPPPLTFGSGDERL